MVFGNRLNAALALVAGMIWGIAIWAINTWLILPWLNEVILQRQMVAPGWWFVYHLIYGGMLFLGPPLARAFGHRRTVAAPAYS